MIDNLLTRFTIVRLAYKNLSRNRLRSILAALTIVIGILAIALLGISGTTLQIATTGDLGEIGNEILVTPAFEEGVESLDEQEVREIERVADRASVVPMKVTQDTVGAGDERVVTAIRGVESPGELYAHDEGRMPDRHRDGALVGRELADRLDLRIGQQIEVGNQSYQVKTVLERESEFSPTEPNQQVILPPTDIESDGYQEVVVVAETGDEAAQIGNHIEKDVNSREDRVNVFKLEEIIDAVEMLFGTINRFLVGLGMISLIVAGVSILNVMLMSVIERRDEIGVLRATGIHKREVMALVLVEASLLGVFGTFLGIVIALVIGAVLNFLVLGSAFAVFNTQNLLILAVAIFVGITTSVLSGVYPAWKAANERPVEVLRN